MNKSDWALLITMLAYIGISFADIMKAVNTLLAEYGKIILFVLVVGLLYKISKK